MKAFRKILSIILVILLVMTLVPLTAFADELYETSSIVVYNGETRKKYEVCAIENDIFFSALDFCELTGYLGEIQKNGVLFKRGAKCITVNWNENLLMVYPFNYSADIDIVSIDNEYYFSAATLLPWMNVECSEYQGEFRIIKDKSSIWDVIEKVNYEDYMFNTYTIFGDSVQSYAGLSAMVSFDMLINLRWDRMVSVDGTINGASKGHSLYDYKTYKNAIMDMAVTQELTAETVGEFMDNYLTINQPLSGMDEILGIDGAETFSDIITFLNEIGVDERDINKLYNIADTWQVLQIFTDVIDTFDEYVDLFSILKMFEVNTKATQEYIEYIHWLEETQTSNEVLNHALRDVARSMDDNAAGLCSVIIQAAGKIFTQIPESLIAVGEHMGGEQIKLECSKLRNSVFSSMDQYMAIAKIFYSTIWNVAEGYEGMAKVGTYQTLTDTCWSNIHQLKYEQQSEDTIKRTRQSYLMALRTSKENYTSLREISDAKIFGFSIYDGGELFEGNIDQIDYQIQALLASTASTRNDSCDHKEEMRKELNNLFVNVKKYEQEASDEKLIAIANQLYPKIVSLRGGLFYSGHYFNVDFHGESFEIDELVWHPVSDINNPTMDDVKELIKQHFSVNYPVPEELPYREINGRLYSCGRGIGGPGLNHEYHIYQLVRREDNYAEFLGCEMNENHRSLNCDYMYKAKIIRFVMEYEDNTWKCSALTDTGNIYAVDSYEEFLAIVG